MPMDYLEHFYPLGGPQLLAGSSTRSSRARHGGPKGNTVAYSQQCMYSIQWKCCRMQFVYADFRRRMQFRRHSVASIAPSSKSVPRNFSTGNVFSRAGSDMVSILEPLRPVRRTHSSAKQHSKIFPSRPVLGQARILLCDVGRFFENAPLGR